MGLMMGLVGVSLAIRFGSDWECIQESGWEWSVEEFIRGP